MGNESKLLLTFNTLRAQVKQGFELSELSFNSTQLSKTVATLKSDRLHSKPPRNENLIKKWLEAVENKKIETLTARELRFLCWEPQIAHTTVFLNELRNRKITISRSIAKGLTYSLMNHWNSNETSETTFFLKQALSKENTTAYLERVSPFILEMDGPQKIGDKLIENFGDISTSIAEVFGLNASVTAFANAILQSVIDRGYHKVLSSSQPERSWFYSKILSGADKEHLLSCLVKVISAIDKNQNEQAKEELKRFVLFHPNLGDPRLPGYEGNWPKGHAATNKVIEWLSQSDIRFFFDLFIENKSDNQGRKQFWLKYAHCVRGSRVIVSEYDQRRLARQITEMQQKSGTSNLFAILKEKMERSTAFMMNFGNVIVVEFSQSGHACYYYKGDSNFQYLDRTLFWGTNNFSISDLKKKSLCPKPLRHVDGWETNFSSVLARFGLRPSGSGRY